MSAPTGYRCWRSPQWWGGYISVRVLVEVLASLETIPLLSPALELIGMGYTIWFLYRYAIGAENRQELWVQLSKIKDYILSDKTSQ
ncbi:MAG: hypothetical protein HC925_01980 [Coleofasciculaceae cyanobacterium SM2_3_26]|nr:hypothetical protein [Coleofasciculaceae cyanobacterium SM2_3_26]